MSLNKVEDILFETFGHSMQFEEASKKYLVVFAEGYGENAGTRPESIE